VPLATFHDFFTACATVAGALIGLLFVAISVSPGKTTGPRASVEHQATAGAAFTALVNTLVFSLVALLPGGDLGLAVAILAGSGLASTVSLGVLLYRHGHRAAVRRFSQVILLLAPLALYGLQLANGIGLARSPGRTSLISSQGGLAIVFFVYAIARAWQLVGARDPSMSVTVTGLARRLAERNLLDDDEPDPAPDSAPPAGEPEPPAPRG
jgi:multidrug transporter EmrE-like cation transporter